MATPIKYEVYNPESPVHVECGVRLAKFQDDHVKAENLKPKTNNKIVQMLPLDPKVLAEHPLGVLVFETDDERGTPETLRSYNAIRAIYPDHNAIEVGGLVVTSEPEHQGRGWAYAVKPEIYRHIREQWLGWRVLIFANESSLGMNLGMGFEPTDDVPAPAYDYCVNDCKNYCVLAAGALCCDTIIHMPSNYQSLEFATSVAVRKMIDKGLLD